MAAGAHFTRVAAAKAMGGQPGFWSFALSAKDDYQGEPTWQDEGEAGVASAGLD